MTKFLIFCSPNMKVTLVKKNEKTLMVYVIHPHEYLMFLHIFAPLLS